jgi:hypothetical protein
MIEMWFAHRLATRAPTALVLPEILLILPTQAKLSLDMSCPSANLLGSLPC